MCTKDFVLKCFFLLLLAPGDYSGLPRSTVTFDEPNQMECVWLFTLVDSNEEVIETFALSVEGVSGVYQNEDANVEVSIRNVGKHRKRVL